MDSPQHSFQVAVAGVITTIADDDQGFAVVTTLGQMFDPPRYGVVERRLSVSNHAQQPVSQLHRVAGKWVRLVEGKANSLVLKLRYRALLKSRER